MSKHEEFCSAYECSRWGCKSIVRRLSSGAAAARRPAGLRHHAEGVCRTSFDYDLSDGTCRDGIHSCACTVREPSGGRAAEPVLAATASSLSSSSPSSSCALNAPAVALSAMTPTPQGALHSKKQMNQVHAINIRAQSSTCKRRLPSAWSPKRTSCTATAAMACARGVGGRLGTPLGSPHPALEKRIGSSHPLPPGSMPHAAKKAKIAGTAGGGGSSAPGSRFFLPFMSVSAANCGGGSPVVHEMVNDAADDEEDAFRRGPSSGTVPSTSGEQDGVRELGWNGFTLYRYRLDFYQLDEVCAPQ